MDIRKEIDRLLIKRKKFLKSRENNRIRNKTRQNMRVYNQNLEVMARI